MEESLISASTYYYAPVSMYILFWMAGMACVVSAARWLFYVLRHDKLPPLSFPMHVLADQCRNLCFVILVSVIIGLYQNVTVYDIVPEIVVLAVAMVIVFILNQKLSIKIYASVIGFGGACLIGWGITLLLSFVLYTLFSAVFVGSDDVIWTITFCWIGASWTLPVLYLFYRIMRTDAGGLSLKPYHFHRFLWPVLMAYILLLMPLLMQEIANSEKWKDMKRAKPMRKADIESYAFPVV